MTPSSSHGRERAAQAILIVGRGRVGAAFQKRLRNVGADVTSVSARALLAQEAKAISTLVRLFRRVDRAEPRVAVLCILAVRDGLIGRVASLVADATSSPLTMVHTAGALDYRVLEVVRARGIPVAQMHPLLSFASAKPPSFQGATLLVDGDPTASATARELARTLGFVPRTYPALDRSLYHAAAALLANGAAALAEAAIGLLAKGGVDRAAAIAMTGPLLTSVVENVLEVGLPEALSGPVRRGDLATLQAHWRAISGASPSVRSLYLALVVLEIEMARTLRDAPGRDLGRLQRWAVAATAQLRKRAPVERKARAVQIKVPQTPQRGRKNRPKS